jgi:pyruvate ferredoxin oxidoreductase alpha subunit
MEDNLKNFIAKTGNEAIAEAMRQINPDVVAAYPITPATEIVQIFSQLVADGEVDTEFIPVESEHSAMSACVGAASSGARTMTATSAQGLALMFEILNVASGLRLPIVMAVANRALSAPLNIHGDQSDVMGVRDCGWIQLYSESVQEAYDNFIQGTKIAETCFLPVMVNMDGFILTHCLEPMQKEKDKDIKSFLGEPKHLYSLLNQKITVGSADLQNYYFEHKRQEADAMGKSKAIIKKVSRDFKNTFGRFYDLFEEYKLSDAEMVIVTAGSTAGLVKEVIDNLRKSGKKVGLLKIRVFRPLPYQELRKVLGSKKAIAVLDKSESYNSFSGPIGSEIRSVLYGNSQAKIINYIYGLGGRDILFKHIYTVFAELEKIIKLKKRNFEIKYLGVR